MRLSIEPTDPGYAAYVAAKEASQTITVRLNGEVVPLVVTADTVEGVVYVIKASDPHLLPGFYIPQVTLVERLTGQVEVCIL